MLKKINKLKWDLTRFGLTPSKLYHRRFSKTMLPIIFSNSVPKAGTHLVERLLCLHPNYYRKILPTLNEQNLSKYGNFESILKKTKQNQILIGHIHHSDKLEALLLNNSIKHILTVRNPKDVLLSRYHYVTTNPDHFYHKKVSSIKSFEEQLRYCLYGNYENKNHPYLSINETFSRFTSWDKTNTLFIKFEELVGAKGGGDFNNQIEVFKKIFNFLDVSLSDKDFEFFAKNIFFKSSPTFRKGKINSWSDNLNEDLIIEINKTLNPLCKSLGYEIS
tara:strand:+ start:147 stop:974 length:828 start_codon:yes stop_codon:yes gene_type:complete